LNSLAVSLMAFVVIFGGAFVGVFLRNALPELARLGTGLIGTISALVLGLLIGSAKSSYNTQSGQVRCITADIIQLDNMLAQYGSETRIAGDLLRRALSPMVDRIWMENGSSWGPTRLVQRSITSSAEAQ
jgi:hypothetical protein